MIGTFLRTSGALALLLLFGFLGVSGWRALDRPIAVVRVDGELTAAERARAQELLSSHLPAGVLSVDTRRLRDLLERESWVDTVALWRTWPDGLRVEVRAEAALARWRDGALLSARGRVIEPLELVGADALPHLSGPEGSAVEVMQTFQRIADVLRPHELRMDALDVDDDGNIRVHLRNGPELILGHRDLGGRLQRVDLVLHQKFSDGLAEVERVDARYDNGVAVAWREGASQQGGESRQLARGF